MWSRIEDAKVPALAAGLLSNPELTETLIILQTDTTVVAMDEATAIGIIEGLLAVVKMQREGIPKGMKPLDLDATLEQIAKASKKNRKALGLGKGPE